MTKTMTMCCLVCSLVSLVRLLDRSTKQCFFNSSSSIWGSSFFKEAPSTITMGREIRASREEGWHWEAGWGWAWWLDGRWWRWWPHFYVSDDVMAGCWWYWLEDDMAWQPARANNVNLSRLPVWDGTSYITDHHGNRYRRWFHPITAYPPWYNPY